MTLYFLVADTVSLHKRIEASQLAAGENGERLIKKGVDTIIVFSRCSVVGTMLQAGRSRVRDPMR
jgi:hypothetical protein